MRLSEKLFSGKDEKQFFEFIDREFAVHARSPVGVFWLDFCDALAERGGDDGESGAVEGAGDGGELSDDLAAVAACLDGGDDGGELPVSAFEAIGNFTNSHRIVQASASIVRFDCHARSVRNDRDTFIASATGVSACPLAS